MRGPRPTLGPYELLGELGRGGMGIVLRARHRELGVERALKALAPEPGGPSPERLARFERELHALARVEHPNVVRVHDWGAGEGGQLFFAMDLVEGESLEALLARDRLPLARALELAADVCRGAAALHRAGVIHRDLKPGNVVVTASGRPVILDLGLAVSADAERLTRTGGLVGTPRYMAPEQLDSRIEPTPRLDVYALGLIVFELCTGSPAVEEGRDLAGLMADVLERDRPPPSARDPDLPVALDEVCARACSRDPQRRYASADDLAQALDRLRAAPGPSRRAARRRRWLAGAAGALALVALALALPSPAPREQASMAPPPPEAPARPEVAPSSAPAPLGEDAIVEGRRALRDIERLPAGARLAAAAEWLRRYPGHPEAETARRVRYQVPHWERELSEPRSPVLLTGRRALIAFSPRPGKLRFELWDTLRDEAVAGWDVGFPAASGGAARASDGASAFVGAGRFVHWFDAEGRERGRWNVRFGVESLGLTPDGARLAVGGRRGEVALLDVARGEVVLRLEGAQQEVRDVAISRDGALLLGAVGEGSLKDQHFGESSLYAWALPSGRLLSKLRLPGLPSEIALDPSGALALVGCVSGHILIVDITEGALVGELAGPEPTYAFDRVATAHGQNVHTLQFSADGSRLLSAAGGTSRGPGGENALAVWDWPARRELGERLRWERPTNQASFGPEGTWVLVRQYDRFTLWAVPPAARAD